LDALVAAKEERERVRIREQALSMKRVAQFRDDFDTAFRQRATLRAILGSLGLIEYRAEWSGRGRWFGFAQYIPKGAFVDDTGQVEWPALGSEYGAGMANGENAALYDVLARHVDTISVRRGQIVASLVAAISRLRRGTDTPDVILLGLDPATISEVRGASEFRGAHHTAGGPYDTRRGFFDDIAVYLVDGVHAPEIMVLSLKASVRLVQAASDPDAIFRSFNVQDFSTDKAETFVRLHPDRLLRQWRSLPLGEQAERLTDQVLVEIEEP
jgi:hypothetical protein